MLSRDEIDRRLAYIAAQRADTQKRVDRERKALETAKRLAIGPWSLRFLRPWKGE